MVTIKQEEAAKIITENHGNVSKTMRRVGYAENTAKKPQNLTESNGWKELMEQYLPDKDLTKVHKEGLKATRHISATQYQDEMDVPDQAIRHKYLETGYKIKGKMKDSETPVLDKGDTYIINPRIQILVQKFEEDYRKELEK